MTVISTIPRLVVEVVPHAIDGEVLVVGRVGGRIVGPIAGAIAASGLAEALDRVPSVGGASRMVPSLGRLGSRDLIAVDLDHPAITSPRAAVMAAARMFGAATHVVVALPGDASDPSGHVRSVVEAVVIGRRRFDRFRTGGPGIAECRLTVASPWHDADGVDAAAEAGRIVGESANWVRDLVDTPPNAQSPADLAAAIADRAGERGVDATIHGADDQWPALRAVGGGSVNQPCVVRLSYRGIGGTRPIVLVGKGITFDAGGLDLKTLPQMTNMKHDMAGAAAVAGTVIAAAELGLRVDVDAVLPLAENVIGGSAMRPGDVVRHADGTCTEILGPDAEGRLILADALIAARQLDPTCLIDVATLTGGGGLGPAFWALLGSDAELTRSLLAAGVAADERGWQLPLHTPYRRFLDSDIADRSNVGGSFRYGFDTLLASTFLAGFTGGIPWAHLDISSTAARDARTADDVWPRGSTGAPTRALVEWLANESREAGGE